MAWNQKHRKNSRGTQFDIQVNPLDWAPDPLSVLSGLLIALAFPPWNFWPLIWVALIPWFFVLGRASSLRTAVVQSVWLSVLMSILGFHWVAHALAEFGNLPGVVGALGLGLYSLFGEPQFYCFACIFWLRIHPRVNAAEASARPFRVLSLGVLSACLYVGIDWLCPKTFMDALGHALWKAKYLRQAADLGGASLLSFLIFLVNDAIYFNLRGGMFKRVARQKLILALTLCGLFWVYGYFRWDEVHQILKESSQGVQVAAIQANIGDFEKVASEHGVAGAAFRVVESYSDLTKQVLTTDPRPQLVVWPETSYPSIFGKPRSSIDLRLDGLVEGLVNEIKVPLLFGGYDTQQGKDFNTFFFFSPRQRLQAYHKNILLLFGEYIPGADSFPFIKSSFPQVGNFGRGLGPEVLSVPYLDQLGHEQSLRIAPIICYEALFSNFVIASARQGGQAIFNITNDGWFGEWGEPQLHLALSTFRSIETRLPLFRSTNTGISALILPDGEIQDLTEVGARTTLSTWMPISRPIPTLMKAWGDWVGPAFVVLGVLGVLFFLGIFDSPLTLLQPIASYGWATGGKKAVREKRG